MTTEQQFRALLAALADAETVTDINIAAGIIQAELNKEDEDPLAA